MQKGRENKTKALFFYEFFSKQTVGKSYFQCQKNNLYRLPSIESLGSDFFVRFQTIEGSIGLRIMFYYKNNRFSVKKVKSGFSESLGSKNFVYLKSS